MSKVLQTYVHNNFIYNSQTPETSTIQMSINKWMDKQIVIYPYNGMLLSNKKKNTTVIVDNMLLLLYWVKEVREKKEYILYIILKKM